MKAIDVRRVRKDALPLPSGWKRRGHFWWWTSGRGARHVSVMVAQYGPNADLADSIQIKNIDAWGPEADVEGALRACLEMVAWLKTKPLMTQVRKRVSKGVAR